MPVEFIGMIATKDQSETRLSRGPIIDKEFTRRFVRAHEDAGFDRVLIGYASSHPDGTQVAAYAASHSERLGFLVAHRPGFVAPTLASTSAAAQGVKIPANLGVKINNPAGAASYPITSQTFIVVNKDLCKAGIPGGESAAKGVVKFIVYGLGEGQSILSQADYAALPAAILAKSKAAAAALECNGSPLGG